LFYRSLRELGNNSPDRMRRQIEPGLRVERRDDLVERRRVGKLVAQAQLADRCLDEVHEQLLMLGGNARRSVRGAPEPRQAAGLAEVVEVMKQARTRERLVSDGPVDRLELRRVRQVVEGAPLLLVNTDEKLV